jgi:hypothetical protein
MSAMAAPLTLPRILHAESGIKVAVKDYNEVERRWDELEIEIKSAFAGAPFEAGFGPDSPLTHTHDGVFGPQKEMYRHIVAEDAAKRIVGASFRVPVKRYTSGTDADPGWFFISRDLESRPRVRAADIMVDSAHRVMRDAGFIRVVTNMGTRDGAAFLSRRHGYVHEPSPAQQNRWVRVL